jgi:hypothetical protein
MNDVSAGKHVSGDFFGAECETWITIGQDDPRSTFRMDEDCCRLRRRFVFDQVRDVDAATFQRMSNTAAVLIPADDTNVFCGQSQRTTGSHRGGGLAAAPYALGAQLDLGRGQQRRWEVWEHQQVVDGIGSDAHHVNRFSRHGESIRLDADPF